MALLKNTHKHEIEKVTQKVLQREHKHNLTHTKLQHAERSKASSILRSGGRKGVYNGATALACISASQPFAGRYGVKLRGRYKSSDPRCIFPYTVYNTVH